MIRNHFFVSDVHIGPGFPKQQSKYTHNWEWLSDQELVNFNNFLTHLKDNEFQSGDRLILIGDIFDNWVWPHDLPPVSMTELLKSDRNKPVINTLNLISENFDVFYVPGNHDQMASRAVIKNFFPKFKFCPQRYTTHRLIAEHGHRYALFNAPAFFSSNINGLPLGYFISRIEATRYGLTAEDQRNYRTYVDDILEIITGQARLPEAVFEAVMEEAGFGDDEVFLIDHRPSGVTAKEIKETYKRIYDDWPANVVSPQRAVLAELDYLGPIADKLCKNGENKVCIFGHSHKAEIDKDSIFCADRVYANTGYWCDEKCTFVRVSEENTKYTVALMKWNGTQTAVLKEETV
ncbi:metallophosphoesterase [Myxococcota bacterium]|nr:metallophosphoesterase [Myxococcota bacterium]MBU1497410.1 metallophosphoesterase [Myxococcota bacterium]